MCFSFCLNSMKMFALGVEQFTMLSIKQMYTITFTGIYLFSILHLILLIFEGPDLHHVRQHVAVNMIYTKYKKSYIQRNYIKRTWVISGVLFVMQWICIFTYNVY